MWYQGTVEIEGGGTSATTVPEALTKLGYLPISSLGQAGGTTPLVGGVIPKQYLGLSNLGSAAVMGAVRMMAGSQRTLSITNFDSFETYSIKAKYGTVGTLSTAGATAGDFLYTAPSAVPAAGYDSITINGIDFNIDILAVGIDTPSIAAPVENFSGGISSIGTFTSSAYSAGSTTIIDTVSIGGAGTLALPSGTEKVRVINRTGSAVVLSQAGTTKNVPANSVLEWVGNGSWIYSVLSGKVLVEALKGANTHAASDWQIASDLQFTSLVKQSLNDTVNKVSWPSTLTQPGIYYVRVRHIDSAGNSSAWSTPRRIAPVADAPTTRQTSYGTAWGTLALTVWNTTTNTNTTDAWFTSWTTATGGTFMTSWTTSWSLSTSVSNNTSYTSSRITLYNTKVPWTTSWTTYSAGASHQTMGSTVYPGYEHFYAANTSVTTESRYYRNTSWYPEDNNNRTTLVISSWQTLGVTTWGTYRDNITLSTYWQTADTVGNQTSALTTDNGYHTASWFTNVPVSRITTSYFNTTASQSTSYQTSDGSTRQTSIQTAVYGNRVTSFTTSVNTNINTTTLTSSQTTV